jgi:hypothetical protein
MAQETEARQLLKAKLEEAWPSIEVKSDRLHLSLGDEEPVIGIFPERRVPSARDKLVNELNLVVQFFGKYEKKVDRNQSIDPSAVEAAAETFAELLASNPRNANIWYFELTRLEYPPDPTGNITRFVAYVTARANNLSQPIFETV